MASLAPPVAPSRTPEKSNSGDAAFKAASDDPNVSPAEKAPLEKEAPPPKSKPKRKTYDLGQLLKKIPMLQRMAADAAFVPTYVARRRRVV